MQLLLSLCIPTNGIVEWVMPVLDSIYNQRVDENLYEVVIADNGNNIQFEHLIREYTCIHSNLIYKKTNAQRFMNQVEAFKLARGEFIKFVNHRDILVDGTIEYLLLQVQQNIKDKPVMYFTNGTKRNKKIIYNLNNFDEFVNCLSYMSSWSGGTSIWKEDFIKISESYVYDELFPHTAFVFAVKNNRKYIVNDKRIFAPIKADETKKGKYKLYEAFAVNFPNLIMQLENENNISKSTKKKIMRDMEFFLAQQYLEHEINKVPCSYELEGFYKYTSVYFNPFEIKILAYLKWIKNYMKGKKH